MKVLVTGAGGLIGRTVTSHLLAQGYQVNALVRRSEDILYAHPLLTWHVGDIRNIESLTDAVRHVDAVVHLAGAKSDEKHSWETNVTGTQRLLTLCEQEQSIQHIIYTSSISTKFKRKGLYAETKQAADELAAKSTLPITTLKLSVVYGDTESGILGTLVRYTRLPLTPLIGNGTVTFQPIHVDDVASAIEKIIARGATESMTYELGGRERISLRDFARMIGSELSGRSVRFLYIPTVFGTILARGLAYVLKKPPVTVSNVIGMTEEAEVDAEPFYNDYTFSPQSLSVGLAKVKRLQELQSTEPYALLRYVSRKTPDTSMVTRYEQAIQYYALQSHVIDPRILQNPVLLGALDAATRITHRSGVFQRKLLVAAALFECSPTSAGTLLPRPLSRTALIFRLSLLGIRAGAKLALGMLLLLIMPRFVHRNA